jgi:hypothetical protein
VLRLRPILPPPNQGWTFDFACDVAANGRPLQIFSIISIISCYTRKCLTLELDASISSPGEYLQLILSLECPH